MVPQTILQKSSSVPTYCILPLTINVCLNSQESTNKEYLTAVVVEYTNNRLYMGVLEEDELTNCKSHIGKLDEHFKMGKANTNSLVLNKKDKQKFGGNEKQFLILHVSFKCQIKDLRLIINDERYQEITKEVLHYQQQQKKF